MPGVWGEPLARRTCSVVMRSENWREGSIRNEGCGMLSWEGGSSAWMRARAESRSEALAAASMSGECKHGMPNGCIGMSLHGR